MKPFNVHTGRVAILNRSNVDTDQIIPKQFLKRIERTGFGQFLFFDWRFLPDQTLNPDFELNRAENRQASILVARRNFGSGSSREHAVWALEDYGFRAILGESFSDIFFNNCFKNGVLPVVLDSKQIERLIECKQDNDDFQLTIDLAAQQITDGQEIDIGFEIDPVRKRSLLEGLDDIDMTLQQEDRISAWELARGMSSVNMQDAHR